MINKFVAITCETNPILQCIVISFQGFQQKKAYIATDSPMMNTFDEFWQMICEQQSPLVIMLNNWKEGREVINYTLHMH